MQMEARLELQGVYPEELEIANICQADREINIKMFAVLKAVLALIVEKFLNIRMELMKEMSRTSQSSGNPPSSW